MRSNAKARQRQPTENTPANTTATPEPQVPARAVKPHIISENAVYSIAQAQAALNLKVSTIRREHREGRLRVCQRAGRRFILGKWLLEWLESGELPRKGAGACLCGNTRGPGEGVD
jgi:hypothetical protein